MSRRQIGHTSRWLPAWILLLIVGCHGGTTHLVQRPGVHLGLDECDHCHMILSEERFAAIVAEPGRGNPLFFDDLGCLASYMESSPLSQEASIWVGTDTGWQTATEAVFVVVPDRVTPMGSGLVAYSNASQAGAAAGPKAPIYHFPETFPTTISNADSPANSH